MGDVGVFYDDSYREQMSHTRQPPPIYCLAASVDVWADSTRTVSLENDLHKTLRKWF